tara:strand:- start:596 stop:997 length:402 start_codon:yes stop_codon:yes gene_type:complete
MNKLIILSSSIIFFFISCEQNEETVLLKEFPGTWIWTASCGGFTGACSYPDNMNHKYVQITEDRFFQRINEKVTIADIYQITKLEISETNYPFEKNYELTLGDGKIIEMTFIQNKDLLYLGNGSHMDSYKRDR